MSKYEQKQRYEVKKSHFPVYIFGIILVALLLIARVHYDVLIILNNYVDNHFYKVLFVMLYWVSVSIGITLFTMNQMKKSYEIPMRQLADAANRVSHGDFSVYVPPLHTKDNLDYLDVMIMDFNKMVEELGSIETLKTGFFSNVSHEIKTPIAVIKNSAEILRNSNLDKDVQQEYISTIIQTSEKLSDLINNILKINKLENQNIYPVYQEFDLYKQLCDCVLKYEFAWDKKNIDIEINMEDRVVVEFDENLLELLWTNLISNAIKFTPTGGKISINQYCIEDEIVVSIVDNGCGMKEETKKHIFDKFYQGDTSHAMEGNGLGLALVQRILELHDGSISVKSKLGEGTTFTVYIPMNTLDGRCGDLT